MEAPMTNKTIKHEVKLQKSVIIVLGLLALGVCANAFAPAFSVKEADAAFGGGDGMIITGSDYAWHLADGKLRFCWNSGSEDAPICSSWKK